MKRNCHNSRTTDDIDIKLEPVTKPKQEKQNNLKRCDDDVMLEIVMSLLFFQLTANLEHFGSRIPDTPSVKLIFSLIVTFFLTKNKTRTEKSLTKLSHYCSE